MAFGTLAAGRADPTSLTEALAAVRRLGEHARQRAKKSARPDSSVALVQAARAAAEAYVRWWFAPRPGRSARLLTAEQMGSSVAAVAAVTSPPGPGGAARSGPGDAVS